MTVDSSKKTSGNRIRAMKKDLNPRGKTFQGADNILIDNKVSVDLI